ncbi:hypothetical protein [Microbacterium phyllosphaerae]|uniref:hypothetical protein n=1 Tax=Microbacterium phyllosphaerae TaxID=124798 RepID=UPI003D65C5ED
MRMLGGVVLWVVATLLGLIAAAGFSGAGLGWANGFIKRSFWEDAESEIGIGLSVFGLLGWLVLLGLAALTMRGGDQTPSKVARVTSSVLVALSTAAVVVACVVSIGWPEPASEYPLPPWNRA